MTGRRTLFRQGMKDGIPIMLGYLAVSFTFGILAVKTGIGAGQTVLMSALNLTSAGQFAALSVIAASGSLVELALSQFIINLRYSLMSFSLSQKIREDTSILHRCLMAFGNTDEIFALSSAYPGQTPPWYVYGLMGAAVPGWVVGTALGAVAGSILPLRALSALGVALYAMFCAIIVPPAKENKVLKAVIAVSMLTSLAFSLLPLLRDISSGTRVILLTVGLSALAAVWRPVEDKADAE